VWEDRFILKKTIESDCRNKNRRRKRQRNACAGEPNHMSCRGRRQTTSAPAFSNLQSGEASVLQSRRDEIDAQTADWSGG